LAHGAVKISLAQELVDTYEKQIKNKIEKIIEEILRIEKI